MHINNIFKILLAFVFVFGLGFMPADVTAQEDLEVNAQPYFHGSWTVGMHADWGSVEDAEEYKIHYLRRDEERKEFTPVGVTKTSVRFEAMKNRGAPANCAYHWVRVKAKSDDGETLAEGTDNFCHAGFWIDNQAPAGLTDTNEEMADTLSFLEQVLRDMWEDAHINERN